MGGARTLRWGRNLCRAALPSASAQRSPRHGPPDPASRKGWGRRCWSRVPARSLSESSAAGVFCFLGRELRPSSGGRFYFVHRSRFSLPPLTRQDLPALRQVLLVPVAGPPRLPGGGRPGRSRRAPGSSEAASAPSDVGPEFQIAPRFSRTLEPRSRLSFSKFLCSALPTFSRIFRTGHGFAASVLPPLFERRNLGPACRPVFCGGMSPEHGRTEHSRYRECNGCCVRTLEMIFLFGIFLKEKIYIA